MCTVTWEPLQSSGYRLLFNRDELTTRTPGLPPRAFEKDGIKAIMPIDSQAGGTWISVNSAGISICLINNYGAEQRRHSDQAPSRGKLVTALAYAGSQDRAVALFHSLSPRRYNPFDIFIFDTAGMPIRWRWNGAELYQEQTHENVAFSTGFDIDAVVSNRRDIYSQWLSEGWDLTDYHRSHIPQASSYSVCMHRKEAGTQSMSEVHVSEDAVGFTYWPGPPCATAPLPPVKIKRTL